MIALALLACAGAPEPELPLDSPPSGVDSGAPRARFSITPSGGAPALPVVGGALQLEQAWMMVWQVALRPCATSAARGPLDWLLPRAWAGHDVDDPGATAQPTWVDLLSSDALSLGEALVVEAPCEVNLLVGADASQAAPRPELEGLSVYVLGALQPDEGEAVAVEIATTLAYDQDRALPAGALDSGGEVRLSLALPEVFAGLDLQAEQADRALLRAILDAYALEASP